jgi:hypothetical protein
MVIKPRSIVEANTCLANQLMPIVMSTPSLSQIKSLVYSLALLLATSNDSKALNFVVPVPEHPTVCGRHMTISPD